MEWTAIVLTCPNSDYTLAYQKELDKRKSLGFISGGTILLVVEDPKAQIGSGGATLNALLVLAEHISSKRGFSVVDADVLEESRILLIHSGRTLPYEPCGRPFIALPLAYTGEGRANLQTTCHLDVIIDLMSTKIGLDSPPGVWVCSSDMLLTIKDGIDSKQLLNVDACLLMVPSTEEYAKQHGVCELDDKGECLQNIHFRCQQTDVVGRCRMSNGAVPLVSGVVYLSVGVANTLLNLHGVSPLDACTYLGCDSGIVPIQLSLFFDFLLAMCPGYPEEKFVSGGIYGAGGDASPGRRGAKETEGRTDLPDFTSFARAVVFKHFSRFRCKTILLNGRHTYLTWPGHSYLEQIMDSSSSLSSSFSSSSSSPLQDPAWRFDRERHSFMEDSVVTGEGVGLLNCLLIGSVKIGSRSLVQNTSLKGDHFSIGQGCIISGLKMKSVTRFHLKDDLALIGFSFNHKNNKARCIVTFGCHDDLMDLSTFCNMPLEEFKSRTGISDEDLWAEHHSRSIYNARLFPVEPVLGRLVSDDDDDTRFVDFVNFFQNCDGSFLESWRASERASIEDIFRNVQVEVHMEFKRCVFEEVSHLVIQRALVWNHPLELRGLYKAACIDGKSLALLAELDKIGFSNHHCPGVSARVLANIADLLGEMAAGEGGLRSGPASNQQWMTAFLLLEEGKISEGFRLLIEERRGWLNTNCRLMRAARHYEGACQILIRQAVMSVHKFITTNPCDPPAIDRWVSCRCPARIDISGGWSDTPPITYESGGAVLNAAISVNGTKPICARVRRIQSLELVIHLGGGMQIAGSNLEFLKNYNQPSAFGSLTKACLLCSGLVKYPSDVPLVDQLASKLGSGLEIESWSNLPHGSGLGTSSILAGALMACLWRAAGRSFDIHSLNHAVLYVEQLLTTGGGWQDQVGGLCGGVKLGRSMAHLPLEIEVEQVTTSNEVASAFNRRLLLIYTGQTRLAKNLLQNVVRNWYARDEGVMRIKEELVALAHKSRRSFQDGNLAQLGECMTRYWQLKKALAPGSEPRAVSLMMEALRGVSHGMCMAGAGGGGFMYLVTKEEHSRKRVEEILGALKNVGQPEIYEASIDEEGMTLQVEGFGVERVPFKQH